MCANSTCYETPDANKIQACSKFCVLVTDEGKYQTLIIDDM